MKKIKMKQAFLDVNGVSTRVMTWGRWVEEPQETCPKEIILCITGNPGLAGFYAKFLETIHAKVGLPVWVLCQAGHDDSQKGNIPDLGGNEHLYTTQGQVEHKMAFIKKYVPSDTKLYIVAHSIGSYIALKLLKDPTINKQIEHEYLLFPTIERMIETTNGKFLYNIVRHISWLLVYLSWIYFVLPAALQNVLVKGYFAVRRWPLSEAKWARALIYPPALEKIFFMGYDEMVAVGELDSDTFAQNKSKIKLYYGGHDNWAPPHFCDRLKEKFPDADAQICVRNFEHAFMLNNSSDMGNMVAGWISEKL